MSKFFRLAHFPNVFFRPPKLSDSFREMARAPKFSPPAAPQAGGGDLMGSPHTMGGGGVCVIDSINF